MKTYLFLFSLLLSIHSLGQTPAFNHYHLKLDAPQKKLIDLIEHVEIIRLEETDNSLMSNVEWYLKTPTGFALPEPKTNTVALFDHNGNYTGVINRYGSGPEEYLNITSIWMKNNHIELLSSNSRVLQKYDLKGNYLETVHGEYSKTLRLGSTIPYQEGYLSQLIDPSMNEKAPYSLLFLDEKLKKVDEALPVAIAHPMPINLGKRFSKTRNHLFYKKILNDTVFEIVNKQALPRFKFDFGKQWAWIEPINSASIQNASRVIGEGNSVFEILPDIGEKYITLTYFINIKSQQKGIVNRTTGEFARLDLRKKNKEDYKLFFIQWEADRLISSMAAYDFEEFVQNIKPNQWTIKGGYELDDILASENPVLLKIKFK